MKFHGLKQPLQRHLCRKYSSNTNLIDHLFQRGLITQTTSQNAAAATTEKTSVYLGADPTAQSLHLGNLVPLMALLHFYLRGHTVVPLVGGATGFVGDPSGRMTERQEMEHQRREKNVELIHSQMVRLLENGARLATRYGFNSPGLIKPVNNYDWWKDVSMLGFLSTYGRHIRVSQMLARDSVKNRLGSDSGIGFNEFTYQVLQAYDFYHLYKHQGVKFQLGGNDQWGNITAGIDLISRLEKNGPEPHGLTVPLLTTPSGEKFGKSAGNAVFIDSELTKPYHMYQYLLNSPDQVVEKYLKMFTLMPLEDVQSVMQAHERAPQEYGAQHRLAWEVVSLIHSEETAANAKLLGEIMFQDKRVSASEVLAAFDSEGLLKEFKRNDIVGATWKNLVSDLTGKSKSETGRLVKQGAVYVGLNREVVKGMRVEESDLEGELLLVRVGRLDYYAVRVV